MRSLGNYGKAEVELSSADVPCTLERITRARMDIYDLTWIDEYCIRFITPKRELHKLEMMLQDNAEIKIIKHYFGVEHIIFSLAKRPVLAIYVFTILFLTCWLPSRILFVSVEGNCIVPDQIIIEEAIHSGIRFLSSGRAIRNETVKNSLLEKIPQLQWVGINTYGCRAVIIVRERNSVTTPQNSHFISSIVSSRDGIVRDMVVEEGTAQCRVGQAVRKGQILVSGYTDCGILLKGTTAKAEIYGDTIRKYSLCFPQNFHVRHNLSAVKKKYSIIIGKKRINLFKGSGISGAGCAKIYEEKCFTLPGGFTLPLGVAVEQILDYETQTEMIAYDQESLSEFAINYTKADIQSGRINFSDLTFTNFDQCCVLNGTFYCYEIIGMTHIEERVPEHE